MPKTLDQIKKLLENPTNQRRIRDAQHAENRVRFHSEITYRDTLNEAVTEFLNWVSSLLPDYKAYMFKSLFRFPVKTVSLTDQMFEALEKLFDGRDVSRKIYMRSPEQEDDIMGFLKDKKFFESWRIKSFEAFRRRHNSILICDLPAKQSGDRPEPYWYLLPIDRVVAMEGNQDRIDWILFHSGKDEMAHFDGEAFQIIRLKDGTPISIASTVPHDLGRTPAKFLIDDALNSEEEPFIKKSPLSPEISKLDWFLFHEIGKNHLDLYAGFPIYWGIEEDCDYEDVMNDLVCESGYLHVKSTGSYAIDRNRGSLRPCPACSNSRLNGPGSYNVIAAPGDKDDPVIVPPVGIVQTDVASLKYNTEEHQRLRLELYTNVTGYGGDLKTDQAVNEKQVAASFDTRAGVLKKWKKEFEKSEAWLIWTLAELRNGPDSVLEVDSDYGTEFYLATPEEILKQYREGVAASDSPIVLTMLQDQYYETKHRHNPSHMSRVEILNSLEPLRHVPRSEVTAMLEMGAIEFEEYYLKINFASLIDKFERENVDVRQFGLALDYKSRIQAILKTLYAYGSEKKLNYESRRQKLEANAQSQGGNQ